MQNQDRAIAQLSLIAALAAKTPAGYSLDQRFYCDDEVFAADMREIIVAQVDRRRARRSGAPQGRLLPVQDRQGIDHRRAQRRIDHQRLLQRVPASRLGDLHRARRPRGAPHLPLSRLVLRTRRRAARRPADAGGFLEGGQWPAPLSRAGVPRLHFHQPVRSRAGGFRRHVRRSCALPRLPWASPMRSIAHAESYPTTANWKLVVENFVECYHCAPAHPEFCSMHPPQALVAFGAGPSSGPADAVSAYLPSLKAWEARAAALGRPIGTVDDGPESSHLRLLLAADDPRGVRERDPGRHARRAAHGQAHVIRPGPDVSLVQPLHAARGHQRFRRAVSFHAAQAPRAPMWIFTGWSTARPARSTCRR